MFVVNLGKFTIHLIGDKVVAIPVLFLYFTSKIGEIIQFHHPRWWKTMDQKSYLDVHGSTTPQVVFDLVRFWQSEISRWLPQKNRTVAGREFHSVADFWPAPKWWGHFWRGNTYVCEQIMMEPFFLWFQCGRALGLGSVQVLPLSRSCSNSFIYFQSRKFLPWGDDHFLHRCLWWEDYLVTVVWSNPSTSAIWFEWLELHWWEEIHRR